MRGKTVKWVIIVFFVIGLVNVGGEKARACEDNDITTAKGVVRENVKVIQPTHVFSGTYDEEADQFTLGLSPHAPEVKEGDVLVVAPSELYPHGMICKTIRKAPGANGTVVITKRATLSDVFSDLDLIHRKSLQATRIVYGDEKVDDNEKVIRVRYLQEGVDLSMDSEIPRKGELGGIFTGMRARFLGLAIGRNMQLNGDIHFYVHNDLEIHMHKKIHCYWDWDHSRCYSYWDINGTHFKTHITQTGYFSVTGSASAALTYPITLAEVDLPAIDIQVGPVPLVFFIKLMLIVQPSIGAQAGLTLGLNYTYTTTGGIEYENSKWSPVEDFTPQMSPYATPEASVFAQVAVGPQIGVFLYDVIGPVVGTLPFVEGDITANGNLDFYGGLEGLARFSVGILGIKIASSTFILWGYKDLLESRPLK